MGLQRVRHDLAVEQHQQHRIDLEGMRMGLGSEETLKGRSSGKRNSVINVVRELSFRGTWFPSHELKHPPSPRPGIEAGLHALQLDSLPTEPAGKPQSVVDRGKFKIHEQEEIKQHNPRREIPSKLPSG